MKNYFTKIRNYLYLKAFKLLIEFEKFLNKGFALNILSADFIDDPYSTYSSMRSKKKIYYSSSTFLHWVTNMEYVQDMLRNKDFSVDDRKYSIAKRRSKELIKDGWITADIRKNDLGYYRAKFKKFLNSDDHI